MNKDQTEPDPSSQQEETDDFSMFLDEIVGDVVHSDEEDLIQDEQQAPTIVLDQGLGDIAEEEDEDTQQQQQDSMPSETANVFSVTPPKSSLPKTVQFESGSPNRSPERSPNRSPKGSPSRSPKLYQKPVGYEGLRFLTAPVKLGVRRSSMTPLGMRSDLAYHRRKISMPQIPKAAPSLFDHTPHDLFVQLDELENDYHWKQRARWIKFEETVEVGANRWGKPHVSSLSFTSLLDLRKCIEQGVVLLDIEEDTMQSIASKITQELSNIGQLTLDNRAKVLKILQHDHKHLEEWSPFIRRRSSVAGRRKSSAIRRLSTFPHFRNIEKKPDQSISEKESTNDKACKVLIKVTDTDGEEQISDIYDPAILKRIPEGAETCTILVGRVEYLDKPLTAFVRLSQGRAIDNLTEVPLPARFIFLLLGSSHTCLDYRETGRALGTLMSNTTFRDSAYLSETRKDLLKSVNLFLDEATVLPPGGMDEDVLLPIVHIAKLKEKEMKEKEEQKEEKEKPVLSFDPLKRTGCPFGSMIRDMRYRYPKYWSDIRDGLNIQSLAAFFFMYFACLTPVMTFGGLLSDKTDQLIGVPETMLGSFILGTVFSLFGGQPLMLMGVSAPFIVFEEALYQASMSLELEFLPFRFWVSVWTAVITVIIVAVEGVFLVRYITAFTKEVFGMLIPLIYIVESFIKINKYFVYHPLASEYPIIDDDELITNNVLVQNQTLTTHSLGYSPFNLSYSNISTADNDQTDSEIKTGQPNTALLSMNLTVGTFVIAFFLRQFRESQYLGKTARRLVSDFGVPIAIAVMVLVDVLIKDTYTDKLNVPDGVTPTNATKRGWVVHPLGSRNKPLAVWVIFAALIPGLLLFTLLFMEVLITSLIVNKKERKLKKGPGYNMDMFIIGTATIVSGICGFPYLSVPIVRCIAQIQSLEVYSKTHAPGEKPRLERVQEHRLVNFCVHVMIGLSTLLGPVLREIPIAVLFGVLLFMGVKALCSSALFERVLLMFMPPKHHPHVGYVTNVRMLRMHVYTALQLTCLAVLWAVKSTKAALGFPFVLIMMVPFRLFVVRRIFTVEELRELDSDSPEKVVASYKLIEDGEGTEAKPLTEEHNNDNRNVTVT